MKMKKIVTTLALMSLLAVPGSALAQIPDDTAQDIGFDVSEIDQEFQGIRTQGALIDSLINIINALLLIAAIVAVVFVIIGGVRYVTSQGDEDAAIIAKNTIIYAIVGIIIIILSAVLINFFVSILV